MTTKTKTNLMETLQALSQLEAAMARLYLSCSEAWQENSSFWMGLAVEEEKHEKIIVDLSRIVDLHPEQFDEGLTIEPSAVESFIAAIEEKTSDIREGEISINGALSFAMKMEESILEGRFFEMVRSEDQRFTHLVDVMAGDLARHRQRIIDEMERLASSQ